MATKKTTKTKATKAEKIAVIETGGKQYLVSEGSTIVIEKLSEQARDAKGNVSFDKVILTGNTTSGAIELGSPYLKSAVEGIVVEDGKGKKIKVVKFKSKSNYHRSYGHRQPFTKVKITKIALS